RSQAVDGSGRVSWARALTEPMTPLHGIRVRQIMKLTELDLRYFFWRRLMTRRRLPIEIQNFEQNDLLFIHRSLLDRIVAITLR
ncbi:MAG: hypothetical protein OXC63_07690, partial [Aestuariivita sp.]|nr:hypothetical protein [Aestuariivita sp.]MCY4347042.1 hypothetical protein [Aestuariivita sp.]